LKILVITSFFLYSNFQFDYLGLKNNPLGDEILSLFARPNGTYEVMNYLREKWAMICSYKISLTWPTKDLDLEQESN